MDISPELALPISAVERETGLSKDVLRKWESRYGFPVPLRDGQGERAYPPDQVRRLRLIKRLMDSGMRPSRIVAESEDALDALARSSPPPRRSPAPESVETVTLDLLRGEDPFGLRRRLYGEMLRRGIEPFVHETLVGLGQAVGEAWTRGEIGIHEEHLYSETVQGLLRDTVAQLADSRGSPRVLLTTLPDEQHGLGLLMAAALLTLRGAYCISLGTQTPVADIAQAARAHHADVVALSFSHAYPQRRIQPALAELRQRLPPSVGIWAGGAGCARLAAGPEGTCLVADLGQALTALAEWRARREAAGAPAP